MKHMRKGIIALSTILMSLFIVSCETSSPQEEIIVKKVKSHLVSTDNSSVYKQFSGIVEEAKEVKLSFRTAGPIAKINFEEGDFVKKGQLIAQIDQRDYKIQLLATQAEYAQVKAEVERIEELYRRKSVSANDYDKAIAGLKQITAKLNAHKNALKDTRLIAPFSGYVNNKFFEKNETVDAGYPIMSLVDVSSLEVIVEIPAQLYVNRKNLKSFYASSDILPNEKISLKLKEINPKANSNQLYRMRLKVNKSELSDLAPGMNLNIFMQYNQPLKPGINIPVESVVYQNGKSYVWIIDQSNHLQKQEVITGKLSQNGEIEIVDGLKLKSRILAAGTHNAYQGQKVTELKAEAKTNVGDLL